MSYYHAKINADEQRERMNAIWDALEAERLIEAATEAANEPQAVQEPQMTAAEKRLAEQNYKQIAANARCMLKDGSFKTKWERVLAKTLIDLTDNYTFVESKEIGAKNAEINVLRNFAESVSNRLEKAERSAKEQDNHHYYKIFADGVKTLLEAL
jgi:hypothetical protein